MDMDVETTSVVENVILEAPSGNKYSVRLSKYEIERCTKDPEFYVELCAKYDQLHKDGFVTAIAGTTKILQSKTDVSPEDEEYFISMVQARPLLWDIRIPLKMKGRETVQSLWQEIIDDLGVIMTVEQAKQKWKNIRDSFIRARNNFKKRIPSGASAEQRLEAERIRDKHRNYVLLEFLEDSLSNKSTISNLDASACANGSLPSTSGLSTSRVSQKVPSSSSSCSSSEGLSQADAEFISAVKSMSSSSTTLTATQHFCMRLADGLEKLPRAARNKLEIRFLELLAEEDAKYSTA